MCACSQWCSRRRGHASSVGRPSQASLACWRAATSCSHGIYKHGLYCHGLYRYGLCRVAAAKCRRHVSLLHPCLRALSCRAAPSRALSSACARAHLPVAFDGVGVSPRERARLGRRRRRRGGRRRLVRACVRACVRLARAWRAGMPWAARINDGLTMLATVHIIVDQRCWRARAGCRGRRGRLGAGRRRRRRRDGAAAQDEEARAVRRHLD